MHRTDPPAMHDPAEAARARLTAVQDDIGQALRRAGRRADSVTLVAVSKTRGVEEVMPLLQAGQRHFGENRVQEAQAKWPALRAAVPDVTLHLVGSLQSNKAEAAVGLFDVIHSVDRPGLAEALARAMSRSGRRPACYVQVNIGDEPQKGGVALADLPALLARCQALDLPVIGLMAVPPVDREPAPYFALLEQLARRSALSGLSMGMSGDYATAIALGATVVRIGTALFGPRQL